MTEIAHIVADATRAQNRASDPVRSTWVSANAGSGKTRVLTDRVARLLLAGANPQKILCLTFTKAAAAEMQSRLFKGLGAWAMLDDASLRGKLAAIGEAEYSDTALRQARTLFAAALETPGGLKIQTIHSFCAHILRRFPLEAGVSPDFRELDERDAMILRAEIVDEMIEAGDLGFDAMARHLTDESRLDALYQDILKHRDGFAAFDRDALAKELDIAPDATVESAQKSALARVSIAHATAIAENFETVGGANALKKLPPLKAFVTANAEDRSLGQLRDAFFQASGSFLPNKPNGLATKAMQEVYPAILDHIVEMQDIVMEGERQMNAVRALDKTEALHQFARAFIAAYETTKTSRGLLDFDDQITRARDLLTNSDMAQWVLFRLDGGIDHILVDEAQDTSPAQWSVIEALTEEFIAGQADGKNRTIFVVGDKKQSIFSFQGADPDIFAEKLNSFTSRMAPMGGLQEIDLLHSFRTAAPILQLVDTVFGRDETGALGAAPRHVALPDRPGRVELWPFREKEKNQAKPSWYEPVDMTRQSDPAQVLAREIAEEIQSMIATGRMIPARNENHEIIWRPITPGDIMILVRSRSGFFHALISHLKKCEVPVAGADRMTLLEELVVQDLLSLLRFLDSELDDLSLAEALRSPLFGLSEADLFDLAHDRGTATLWQRLRESDHEACVSRLIELRDMVDFARPYEILDHLLISQGGRTRLVARLGEDCQEAMDELLVQALNYEQAGTPSLSGFLAWVSVGTLEVKREMSVAGSEVRVMTVHGSKGLEAPVVFVPDVSVFTPAQKMPNVALCNDTAIWTTEKMTRTPLHTAVEEARIAKAEREYERLLYVALTRPESWLIFCGATGREDSEKRWYARVAKGLQNFDFAEDEKGRVSYSYRWKDDQAAATPKAASALAIPAYFRAPPSAPPPERPQTSPTALSAHAAHALPGEYPDMSDPALSLEYGSAVHLLLEILPDLPPSHRREHAQQILADTAPSEPVIDEALAVLSDPEIGPLFGDGALRETAITAPFGDGILNGKMDLIRIEGDRVLGIDFKSNRIIPRSAEQTPEAIIIQLAAYRHAMAQIWPEKTIEMAVLWTRAPILMPIPEAALNAALTALAPSATSP